MNKDDWNRFWKEQKPSWKDWDWLESSALRTVSILAVVVVILDTCVWRP